jgi:hypothetical protein
MDNLILVLSIKEKLNGFDGSRFGYHSPIGHILDHEWERDLTQQRNARSVGYGGRLVNGVERSGPK